MRMAQRMASDNMSSDSDNAVNTRSKSPVLSLRLKRRPLFIPAIILLSAVAFLSSLPVQSFPVSPFSGQNSVLKQRQGQKLLQGQSSSLAFTTNQQKQRQHLCAASNDDCNKEDPITFSVSSSTNNEKTTEGAETAAATTIIRLGPDDGYDGLGEYDPSENLPQTEREVPNVGDPQLRVKEKDWSVTDILKELAAIQQKGPQKYCILGTRHCSYLHQQIIELLAYALVLSGNHVYTSGAPGTNAATVRGALRAEREDLLTVVLPQSLEKQTKESQELLEEVDDLITMPQNDDMPLDVASRICNSYLLSLTDQLVSFAFHESTTVIEANKEAKALDMLVTTLYLD